MTSTIESSRIIEDIRLIAGYLRDAALSNHYFVITVDHQEIIANLSFIEEPSSRDKKNKRRLHFQIVGDQQSTEKIENTKADEIFAENHHVSCRVALDRVLMKFNSILLAWDKDTIVLESPHIAGLLAHREKYRFSAKNLIPKSTMAVISKENEISQFAHFEINDISSDGIGGYLVSETELPLPPFKIKACLRQDLGAISLDGNVIRIEKLNKTTQSLFKYKIGIQTKKLDSHKPDISSKNKRKASRLSINIPIEVKSPLNPKSSVSLEVIDLSYSGISAKFFNKSDSVLFQSKMIAHMVSPRLNLEIQSIEKETVKFKILPSNISEHIQLFYLKSILGDKDLTIKTPIPEDIIQVYSVSGSLSSGLIKNIKLFRENILNSLHANNHTTQWFLRWMQQNDEGRIRSVVMTVPFGENLWYCGGAAGHMDPELKMSSNFLKRYFTSNIEFLSTLGTNEYVFFNWFLDNSRWNQWENQLSEQTQSTDFFRFDGDIAYFNDTSLKSPPNELYPREFWTEIRQGQFEEIEKTLSLIDSVNLKRLVGMLGLNPYSFGANRIKDLLFSVGKNFDRKCFRGKFKNTEVIAIYSTFPSYASPNGILNYPYLFTNHALDEDDLEALGYFTLSLAISIGIECHGFFISNQGKSQKITESKHITLRKIRWTFGLAETVWKYWMSDES